MCERRPVSSPAPSTFCRPAMLVACSLLPSFGRALFEAGQWDRAEEVLSEAVREARAAGDRRLAAEGDVALTHLRLFSGFRDHS